MELGAVSLVVIALASAAVAWALTRIVFGLPLWVALPAVVALGYLVPRMLLQRQRRKMARAFSDLFPDALDAIGRMLRAGLPISAAVQAVSAELPPPVNAVFAMVADQMGIGVPIDEALDVSSRYIGMPDFRFFTVAVVLQHMTGGNLAGTLGILSEIVRKRRAVRLKAGATTAEIRVFGLCTGRAAVLHSRCAARRAARLPGAAVRRSARPPHPRHRWRPSAHGRAHHAADDAQRHQPVRTAMLSQIAQNLTAGLNLAMLAAAAMLFAGGLALIASGGRLRAQMVARRVDRVRPAWIARRHARSPRSRARCLRSARAQSVAGGAARDRRAASRGSASRPATR